MKNLSIHIIAATTLLFFTCVAAVSFATTVMEDNEITHWEHSFAYMTVTILGHHVGGEDNIKPKAIKAISAIVFVLSIFKILFTILLVIGVKMNKPILLVLYLAYGLLMTIIMMITGLLLMLGYSWYPAIVVYLFVLYYMFGLVKVYNAYETIYQVDVSNNNEFDHLVEE